MWARLSIGVFKAPGPHLFSKCQRLCALLQEFNIEKLQLLENEKGKIKKEYERRHGTIDTKKKM